MCRTPRRTREAAACDSYRARTLPNAKRKRNRLRAQGSIMALQSRCGRSRRLRQRGGTRAACRCHLVEKGPGWRSAADATAQSSQSDGATNSRERSPRCCPTPHALQQAAGCYDPAPASSGFGSGACDGALGRSATTHANLSSSFPGPSCAHCERPRPEQPCARSLKQGNDIP